jgi:hypothetical protein
MAPQPQAQAPHYGYAGLDDPVVRDSVAWEVPAPAAAGDGPTLSAAQVRQWHGQRFLVIDDVWPRELIAEAVEQWEALQPAPSAALPAAEAKAAGAPAGGFPWGEQLSAARLLPLHPRILRAVAQLLDTEEIMLTQSGAGAKYGVGGHEQPRLRGHKAGFGEVGDQPLHKDFGNNIVLVPGIDTPPEAVNCILYLSDVADCGGATGIVPHSPGTYDIDDGRAVNFLEPHDRYSLAREPGAPGQLYAQERLVQFKPGTALLYRQDTWHRGSCMVEGAVRRTQHLVWRRMDAPWVQYGGPWHGASPAFLSQLSAWQRSAIGWPMPGNAYWTEANIRAVSQRYPGVDMTEYYSRLVARGSKL